MPQGTDHVPLELTLLHALSGLGLVTFLCGMLAVAGLVLKQWPAGKRPRTALSKRQQLFIVAVMICGLVYFGGRAAADMVAINYLRRILAPNVEKPVTIRIDGIESNDSSALALQLCSMRRARLIHTSRTVRRKIEILSESATATLYGVQDSQVENLTWLVWPSYDKAHEFAMVYDALPSNHMADNLPNDSDGDALRRLLSHGSDITKEMEIDFSVVVANQQIGEAFAERARMLGYETRVTQDEANAEGAPSWTCCCTRTMIPTYKAIVEAQARLDLEGREFGAHTDGWGSFGNADE